ncbi:tripartite tricarboxylate transporter substrate binding protein [Microbacterium sp. NIBRBAC000506063]|uniref:tripartite tricarboxylate transporter substrate binding protein n=1 Tax=Microbacterium sp. NIBRBAC000506063 TaxID=2734618 RepID=UPI001BB7246E|nr:tripartite tricarboxylate transporter substrate binding protein [Microbacterium sp. NIBRBAC000506063]QTV80296.1 tripartite tricarboxylate transporter substrate binding protein [Microbacterium sp. NIBRBAC000506063]
MNKRFKGAAAAALAGVMVLGMSACANRNGSHADEEGFPTGTITFYTPTSAGGATDLTARTLATQLEDDLGVSVVVDNRPGGAGSVGMEHVGKQAADGYTIAVFPVEVAMLGHLGYSTDPADYDFLGQVNSQPGTIAVPASSPYETLDDLIVAAAAAPHTITVSNAGPGSIWEAGAVALGEAAGVTFQGVPFDGGAPAVTAAIGSQVDAVVAGIGETAPAHQDGRLRVLATFTEERTPALPDVPTATEQGRMSSSAAGRSSRRPQVFRHPSPSVSKRPSPRRSRRRSTSPSSSPAATSRCTGAPPRPRRSSPRSGTASRPSWAGSRSPDR